MKNTTTILREDLLNTPSHQRSAEQGSPTLQPPLPGLDKIVKPFRFAPSPYVYKVVPLREARTPDQMTLCDTPEAAAAYWRLHVPTPAESMSNAWPFAFSLAEFVKGAGLSQ